MIPEDWEETTFSEAVEVNPKRELRKGSIAKSVAMEDIQPFTRKISNYISREFKGGSKFKNGDTLFARITPSLENGKTAFVDILTSDEIGFGSTEFIVLAAKNEKTVPYFVHYLSRNPEVRNIAIKSMTGTSGRQRVENDVFHNIVIYLPTIKEQQTISKILSNLDSKIELNQQMNKTLEEICKAIFKHWFIDFEFPNEQGKPYKSSGGEMVYSKELEKEIPKGWKISTLSENTLTTIGGIWGNENPEGKYSKPAICVRGMDIHEIQNGNQKNLKVLFVDPKTSENRKLNSGDIIVEISGGSTNQLTGRVLFISNELLKRFNHEILPASFCKLIRFSDVNYSIFFYYLLKWVRYIGIISQYETGTTSIKNFQYNIFSKEYKFALPTIDLINTFHQQSSKILIKIESNLYQIQILTKIRDSLLPKLMSGKIRVLVEAD